MATASRSRRRGARGASAGERTLTVAVTGATGTVGRELVPRLARDRRVRRVVALGRERSRAPAGSRIEFRGLELRDAESVSGALDGVDVVVHLGFALQGVRLDEDELFRVNVEGTVNVARAAAATGAGRFVYASSGAVYGFHGDNPRPITEETPLRASSRHFYARHKAQTELLVRDVLVGTPVDLYVLRPCAVVGPDAAGAALHEVPSGLPPRIRGALRAVAAAGLAPALPPLPVPLQFVHAADVAQAAARCVHGQGPPATYNLAGSGELAGAEVVRALGFRALPLPRSLFRATATVASRLPPFVPAMGWSEAGTHPLLLDTSRARGELGWRPRYTSRSALAATRHGLGL